MHQQAGPQAPGDGGSTGGGPAGASGPQDGEDVVDGEYRTM